MTYFRNKLDLLFYKNYSNNWDDKLFREHIIKQLKKDWIILDIGAGAGVVTQMNFKGLVKEVYGVDPDPRISDNPYLDKGYVGLGDEMPFFDDNKFNLIFCDNVFEHVDNPNKFLLEVNRVLKPDGLFFAKTPNKYHYMPIIARLTPTWFHKFYNKIRGREEEDTFPTLYKLNSINDQYNHAIQSGFEVIDVDSYEGRPEYLRITWITYFLGFVYERIVNRLNLKYFKVLIISKWKK